MVCYRDPVSFQENFLYVLFIMCMKYNMQMIGSFVCDRFQVEGKDAYSIVTDTDISFLLSLVDPIKCISFLAT